MAIVDVPVFGLICNLVWFAHLQVRIQNLTKKILSQLSYQIVAVKNGQQVLDLLEKDE